MIMTITSDQPRTVAHAFADLMNGHDPDAVAGRIAYAEGGTLEFTFGELSRASAQFAIYPQSVSIGQ